LSYYLGLSSLNSLKGLRSLKGYGEARSINSPAT